MFLKIRCVSLNFVCSGGRGVPNVSDLTIEIFHSVDPTLLTHCMNFTHYCDILMMWIKFI